MKRVIKGVLKYSVVFIVTILTLNLLLFLACSFDSKVIEKKVKESADILHEQGMNPIISKAFNIEINNNTDSVVINIAYSIDSSNPLKSYLRARKNYKKGQTKYQVGEMNGEGISINNDPETGEDVTGGRYNPVGELYDFVNGNIENTMNYARYWQGYLILFRPLLIIFNLSQMRWFNIASFLVLLLYFMYLLKKRFSLNVSIIYGLSIVCSGYFTAAYTLESTPIFLTMMVASIIFLKRIDKIKQIGVFLFVVGCIANFVDFLTVPVITLGIPLSLYLLKLMEEKKDLKYCIKFLLSNSILWLIAYGLTWLSKWVIYDLVLTNDSSLLKLGFEQVLYRTQRVNEAVIAKSYVNSIIVMVGKSSLYALLTAFVIMCINKFKIVVSEFSKPTFAFLFLSLYPIVWYIVLANHTVLHEFFVYRHTLIYMVGVLLFINQLFEKKKEKKRKEEE